MISVRLVDHMGTDLMVANAARQSFDASHEEWADTPRTPTSRSDPHLVHDLAEEGHVLPFRHPHVCCACVAPLPVARQLSKHQVGMSWSETSRRYKTRGITFHVIEQWRAAPEEHRQGSAGPLDAETNAELRKLQQEGIEDAVLRFHRALELGATLEQVRFMLPQAMNVGWTWTGSLLAWAHLYQMRHTSGTQEETRQFAQMVDEIISPLYPHAWRALRRT